MADWTQLTDEAIPGLKKKSPRKPAGPPRASDYFRTGEDDAVPTMPIRRHHFHGKHVDLKLSTQLVVYDGAVDDPYRPSSHPIYMTSTFIQPDVASFGPYDYSRSGNPTRTALETLVAGIENAHSSFAFSSGMSALAAVCNLVGPGEEIIACADLYGGMHRLLTQVLSVPVTFVDTSGDLSLVEAAIKPGVTKLCHIESPSNPLMRITDIKALSVICKKHNVLLSVDNTMMTSLLQRPLDLGADIVVHSGTKFLSGHSDATLGVVCLADEELAKKVAFIQNAVGTALDPFSCFLTLRGMKTMSLRVRAQQKNAELVAVALQKHSVVKSVNYPGFDQRHALQASGGGSLISFTTDDVAKSRIFVDSLAIFKLTVSFGSCNSLVEMPCLLSHASIPKEKRTLPEDLIRLSIGIEDSEDLVADILQALDKAA